MLMISLCYFHTHIMYFDNVHPIWPLLMPFPLTPSTFLSLSGYVSQ